MNNLSRLAARYGIEESFVDARGIEQTATAETRRALLAAMGVDVDSEESAAAALAELDRAEWLQTLSAVNVVLAAESLTVPVTYGTDIETVAWRLTVESGTQSNGQVPFNSLALLQRRELDGKIRERRALVLDAAIPAGYHRLTLTPGSAQSSGNTQPIGSAESSGTAESMLIVTPGQCWLPSAIEQGGRLWGVAAQLYLLKSKANWGMGDFADLRQLAQMLVRNGAQALGLNPLHAMFVDAPEQASPYSPASRLLLNVLNIDVMAVAQAAACAEALDMIQARDFQTELAASRDSKLVDYTRVARLKIPILKVCFTAWHGKRDSSHWQEFEAFRRAADQSFERSCVFLALRQHFAAQTPARPDWRSWPEQYQSPDSAAVQRFTEEQPDLVTFQAWLQFLADKQLEQAAKAAEPMAIGLYRDLAVGADPSGAETWSNQRAVVTRAHVGAPPDIYNPAGQDWGLPPLHPMALEKECYRSFIELLRANMRHAGGLRIDHVMALQQLYWVPVGSTAAQGAYVRYPREDLIGILALESHRNRCLVVGEDLGTVPRGFRERMTRARILSYRVLYFEKDDGGFLAPQRYPELSLAVAGSHDLPTLSAWMTASDLTLKEELGLFPNAELMQAAHRDRNGDREALLAAFGRQGLAADPAMPMNRFSEAAHSFLAQTASAITMVQLDDITQEATPVNVPATSTEHPNWRRRLSKSLEEIAVDPGFQAVARSMNDTRAVALSIEARWTGVAM